MANQAHLNILRQGVDVWNKWRKENVDIQPDLSKADLQKANLFGIDLNHANLAEAIFNEANLTNANLFGAGLVAAYFLYTNLTKANLGKAYLAEASLGGAILHEADLRGTILEEATLNRANLSKANLSDANLSMTDLSNANLTQANLTNANLFRASFFRANLSNANLNGAKLSNAILVETNLTEANLTDCSIYGISAWNVNLEGTIQSNLIITPYNEPKITVDDLEVAQFIHLLLNNKKIRKVIDTITSKVVLILGRFTDERKDILDAIREELRHHNYSPVLFDFDKPLSRDFTETIRTLAYLSRFIVADLTDPSSIPQELQAIIPDLEVPVQPLLEESKGKYAMFIDFGKYHWVLPTHLYKDQNSLLTSLVTEVIEPAEKKARELAIEKVKRLERR
ncbi:MAG TPA: pentapeptide repeat-containing protein [Ktedonobacteraceae bacterium]|nr:pentapeptide repeat-containing protein [Ktedonobacteraceae bacterium]